MGLIADIHKDLEKGAVQLLVEYRGRLHAEALRLCPDPSSAEDLVFRTLEQAIFKIDTFKGEGDLYGWMKSIMTNLHLNDGIRAVNRGTSPASQEELEKLAGECNVTVDELIRNSDSEVLREAIDRLDPEYKRVIVMHYYENLSFKQIAAVLNAPVGTVLWRANMARKLLGKKLRAQLGDSKPKLAVLAALMLAGSLFGAWGIVEAVSSAADEEPAAAESALGSLESEGSLGSLGTGADAIDPNPDTVDLNPDPIVSNSDYIVSNPAPIVPKDSIPAEQISTTENTEKEETMNLKTITKAAAKLAVGAALTAVNVSTATADGWLYADGAITDSSGIRCPVSANGNSLTVNRFTTFSGVTDIDFTKPVLDASGNGYVITAFADAAFYSSEVTSIRLPDTLISIGGFAFQSCTAITNITPFLPSSVTQIGIKAFNGATNLRGELTIGVPGMAFSFAGEQAFDSATSITALALDGAVASMPSAEFYNCTSLEKVVIGEGVQVIGTFAFQMCTALKSVEFKGYSNLAADSSFKTIPEYQVLFEIPSGNEQWKSFLESAENVTPWEGLSADVQQKFYDIHGAAADDPVPYGLVNPAVGGGSTQWIAYKRAAGSKYYLQVVGEQEGKPFGEGVVSPAYGSSEYDVLSEPCRCEVVEAYVCAETTLSECYGYEFTQFDEAVAVDVQTNLSLTCLFTPEAGGSYRVKWLWRPVGYKLTIAYPDELGDVLVDGELTEGYYRAGRPVRVSAAGKNGATFVRWLGDVSAGMDKSASFELVMDGARTVCPYFKKNWQLAGTTMSDGYWNLNVVTTEDSNGQNVVSVSGILTRVDYFKFLDLGKGIDAEGEVPPVLVGLGQASFYAQDIVELTLPETLTTIGSFAFQNCGMLEKVAPFLPPSVSSIGLAAFENCTKLGGTAVLGARKQELVLSERVFSSASALKGLLIRGCSADLPNAFAYSCVSLKRIELPAEMTQLGDFAFQFCTGVETLTFGSRPQWQAKTFDGWPDFSTIVFVPFGDAAWQGVIGDKTLMTPWKDLSDEMRKTFADGHTGAHRPKGLMQSALGMGRQWIDVIPAPGFMLFLF